MNENLAKGIAFERLTASGRDAQYVFDSCELLPARIGRYATPARWIVRYAKSWDDDGAVTDDGTELFVVTIFDDSGAVEVSCGFNSP